jgi:uncharacterized protein YecE (DUF72 family)
MQFGRVADLSAVRFELPPLDPRTLQRLAAGGARAESSAWLRLGAPAWAHSAWVGTLYPPGATARDWLRLYAEKLSAIELNSTFYALPSHPSLERWVAATPEHFRFCPKVPRAISHELDAAELPARVQAFAECVARLGTRLGPALLQLPESVAPARLQRVAALLAAFPPGFALALELRHPGWFTAAGLREELLRLLEAHGMATVITDVAGRRDVCHATLSTPLAFVRFAGEGGHPSDGARSAAWLGRLAEWRAAGLQSAYFFVHQPDDILAPQLLAAVAEQARAQGIALPGRARDDRARAARSVLSRLCQRIRSRPECAPS